MMGLISETKKEYGFEEIFASIGEINPYGELPDYTDLIEQIKRLHIDIEEKADIINAINLLKTNISYEKRNKIIKKIDRFKKENHI